MVLMVAFRDGPCMEVMEGEIFLGAICYKEITMHHPRLIANYA